MECLCTIPISVTLGLDRWMKRGRTLKDSKQRMHNGCFGHRWCSHYLATKLPGAENLDASEARAILFSPARGGMRQVKVTVRHIKYQTVRHGQQRPIFRTPIYPALFTHKNPQVNS